MSGPEDFLSRWSRRKLDPEARKPESAEKPPPAPPTPSQVTAKPEPEFDITTLPSLESIAADSDIQAFLQKGVPAALTRAALRRAWSADPAIRDFVGLSENSWDFNAPESIPGFGSLTAEDVKRLAAQFLGPSEREPVDNAADSQPAQEGLAHADDNPGAPTEAPVPGAGAEEGQIGVDDAAEPLSDADAAAQQGDDDAQPQRESARRRHGGALPQ